VSGVSLLDRRRRQVRKKEGNGYLGFREGILHEVFSKN
jgi:hypothetical protein